MYSSSPIKQQSFQPTISETGIIRNPSNDPKQYSISGYIRCEYEQYTKKIVPDTLKYLIVRYTTFDWAENYIFPAIGSPESISKSDIQNKGSIVYDKNKNYLKVHCYANAYMTDCDVQLPDDMELGHLELIIDGDLHLNAGKILINSIHTNKDRADRIIDILCNNLIIENSCMISGNGGIINMNIENNMVVFEPRYKTKNMIQANSFKQGKGEININIGNTLTIEKGLDIQCKNGSINFNCKSLNNHQESIALKLCASTADNLPVNGTEMKTSQVTFKRSLKYNE